MQCIYFRHEPVRNVDGCGWKLILYEVKRSPVCWDAGWRLGASCVHKNTWLYSSRPTWTDQCSCLTRLRQLHWCLNIKYASCLIPACLVPYSHLVVSFWDSQLSTFQEEKTMPTTHGAGSPNQQLYSLFPKKKKGSKKNEEPEEGVSIWNERQEM